MTEPSPAAAATGKVTLPLPKEFPTADKASPIADK
jgi:hypothetical protein